MNRGALIFAHNSRDVDYSLLAIISGGLAKKHLNIPVSLVTDNSTIEWMKTAGTYSQAVSLFDKIITVEKPTTTNVRKLGDGIESKIVPFVNTNRNSAWELTPYNQTLLLDSDFLIFSDNLNKYWEMDEDVLIASSMNDINEQSRVGYHDRYISDTGVHLYWATTVMFTKNQRSRALFDTVEYVKNNYQHYADLFRFDSRQYRNDISFSVAKHILDGFEKSSINLPSLLTAIDKDILHSVSGSKLTMLINTGLNSNYCAISVEGMDLHIMNKQSIIRNAESLLSLI